MDFGRALTFVKDDASWVSKIAIGAGISIASIFLLGLPALLLIGYQIQVMRNVRDGKDLPLPEWTDFGKLFMDGLYIAVALFVYTLPLWILFCIGFVVMFLPALGGSGDLFEVLGAIAVTVWCVLGCLFFLLLVGLALVAPAINIQYVQTNEFGALFRVGEVLGIARDNIGDIVMTIIVNFVATFMVQLVSGIIPVCGSLIVGIPGAFWVTVSVGHMYGQIAAKMDNKVGGASYAG
jgi:hypothetical protein